MVFPKSEIIVFDIEANGLIEEATNIWCIAYKTVFQDSLIENNVLYHATDLKLCKEDVYTALVEKGYSLVGHNIISYDIPMIKKFYGIDLIKLLGKDKIIDTLIMSQTLFPDRPLPKGCPVSIKNPVTNRLQKVTPHSLEAWGYRLGQKKVEIHDWREFTPEILDRCTVDVNINYKVYLELLREAGIK